jgi:hypothetical protein
MTAPHEPTEKTRKTVEAMSSYGIPQEDISKVIGVDSKTLRKYYKYELDTASAKANSQVAQRLYQKCLDGDTTSMIFWLKTRGQWKETIKNEHQPLDENGNPTNGIRVTFVGNTDTTEV